MRSQIEKSKEILEEEIKRYAHKPMTDSVAEHLSVYYGAYHALCKMSGDEYPQNEWGSANNGKEYHLNAWVTQEEKSTATQKAAALTPALAEKWAKSMENEDGTTGPHWTMEQTKQVQSQKGIDCDPVHFWVAMNMIYSDYGKAAKKLGISNADFYASMAEAFLDDKDAQPDKLERYYQFVVKH